MITSLPSLGFLNLDRYLARHPARRWVESVPSRMASSLIRGLLIACVFAVFQVGPSVAAAAGEAWNKPIGFNVYSVATNNNLIVVGRRDNLVSAFDRAGNPRWDFTAQGTVYGVAISDDGSAIAVASEDRNVYLLDANGKEVWKSRASQTFTSVAITPDGGIITAGNQDRNVYTFDRAGNLLWKFAVGDTPNAMGIYGSAKAFRVVAGTRDSRVHLLSAKGESLWIARLGFSVRSVSVTNNGQRVLVGQQNSQVILLDGATGSTLRTITVPGIVRAAVMSPDAKTLAVAQQDKSLFVYDGEGKQIDQQFFDNDIYSVAMVRDDQSLLVGTETNLLLLARNPNGTYISQQPPSNTLPIVGGTAVVLLGIAAVLGLRKLPTGERAFAPAARNARTLGRTMWRSRISYLFLVPTFALLLTFNYYPALSGIGHAFTAWVPGIETRWVGLQNFQSIMGNRYFWTGMGNAGILILTSLLKLLVPLLVAELIFHLRRQRLQYLMRTLFVIPLVVPGVVGILLWVNIYDPNIGLANQFFRSLGLESWTRIWLGDEKIALGSILFIGFPWVSAFALLIFYGGLISIPTELFDAGQVDGASGLRRFFSIDIPLLVGQIRLLVILGFIGGVQEFSAVFLTTGGGPGSATYLPSLELYYQAVRFNNFGLASAMGALLFVIILAGTIINLRYVRSSTEYNA